MADRFAAALGSWKFIGVQTTVITLWIAGNAYLLSRPFDPMPFILLNLLFSTQAAYAAPILQLASNRQSEKDRLTLEHTYADTEALLEEIKRNTRLTLRIVEHLGVVETD